MVQTTQVKDLTLSDLEEKFGLKPTADDPFFSEWLADLPVPTDLEKQLLDRVKGNYLSLVERRPLSENLVKMVVLAPLLDLAGFYRPPFKIDTEIPVQISAEDEGEVLQGRIDVLVFQQQFWVLVIESKNAGLALIKGVPQALAYMLASPSLDKPAFGLVTNGSDFIFIKLTQQGTPKYALSDALTLWKRDNDLYRILSVLKRLGEFLTTSY